MRNTFALISLLLAVACVEDSSHSMTSLPQRHAYRPVLECENAFAPVCGQPKLEECPAGEACPQITLETYRNDCDLNRQAATYLHEGECGSLHGRKCGETSPVCAQPPMPDCPAGYVCPQVMPQHQTYNNECIMNYARATLVHQGACKEDSYPESID